MYCYPIEICSKYIYISMLLEIKISNVELKNTKKSNSLFYKYRSHCLLKI